MALVAHLGHLFDSEHAVVELIDHDQHTVSLNSSRHSDRLAGAQVEEKKPDERGQREVRTRSEFPAFTRTNLPRLHTVQSDRVAP